MLQERYDITHTYTHMLHENIRFDIVTCLLLSFDYITTSSPFSPLSWIQPKMYFLCTVWVWNPLSLIGFPRSRAWERNSFQWFRGTRSEDGEWMKQERSRWGGHTKQEWVLSWELVNLNHLKVLEHNLHHRFTPCTQGGRNAYPMLKRSAPSSSRGARSFRWGGDIWQGTGPIHWRKGSCAWLLANTCSNQGWVSAPMWLQQGTNSVQFSTSSRANMAVGMLFLPPQAVHQSLLCRRELGTAPLLLTQHFGPLWSLKAV